MKIGRYVLSALLIVASMFPSVCLAQADMIRMPNQPIAGQEFAIELFSGVCNYLGSDLYDIALIENGISATVDSTLPDQPCPPTESWHSYQIGPFPAGNYNLSIYAHPFNDSGTSIGPDYLYATIRFSVQSEHASERVPALTTVALFLLCSLMLVIGWNAGRHD